jgi:hypothetical protein
VLLWLSGYNPRRLHHQAIFWENKQLHRETKRLTSDETSGASPPKQKRFCIVSTPIKRETAAVAAIHLELFSADS